MAANHPARNPVRSPAQFFTISKRLPTLANATPPHFRAINSEDNSQVGAQPARNVLVAVQAKVDATSRGTSRKPTRWNFSMTFESCLQKNYEHITININTRSRSAAKNC
jgi:hypothetical protein